jgi:hypothetical protein
VHRRFAGLSLAFSVFLLVCAQGWAASEALRRVHDGPRFQGISGYGILGLVALLELGVLLYGGVAILDDRNLLLTLVGARAVDARLLALNLGVTALVLILCRLWTDLPPAETGLVAIHVIFAITLIRAPSGIPPGSP